MRESGQRVSTSGRTPLLLRKRSATASLILSAAKFKLLSGLCCAVISILKLCLGVNHSSHATLEAALYRSCSERYWVYDSSTNTRWAKRLCRLSSMASRHEPRTITPARKVRKSSAPRPVMRCTSVAR